MIALKPAILASLACLGLAACAAPESQAQAADDAACTAQADTQYRQSTLDTQARTAQNGLMFPATPSQVFGAEQMGAQSQREHAITDCETNGNGDLAGGGAPMVAPHIVN